MQSPRYAIDNTIWPSLENACGEKDKACLGRIELTFSHGILSLPRFEAGSVKELDESFFHAAGSIHSVLVKRDQNNLTVNELAKAKHLAPKPNISRNLDQPHHCFYLLLATEKNSALQHYYSGSHHHYLYPTTVLQ